MNSPGIPSEKKKLRKKQYPFPEGAHNRSKYNDHEKEQQICEQEEKTVGV